MTSLIVLVLWGALTGLALGQAALWSVELFKLPRELLQLSFFLYLFPSLLGAYIGVKFWEKRVLNPLKKKQSGATNQ